MNPAASTPVSPPPPTESGDPPKSHLRASASQQLPPMDPSPALARPAEATLPTPGASEPGQQLKPNACISCQRRKVKCDRMEPCSSCRRYRAVCEFRDPAPRRKRKLSDEDLHAKLDRYESLLNSFGARVEGRPEPAPSERPASGPLSTPGPGFTPLNAPRPQPPQNGASSSHYESTPTRTSPVAPSRPHETGRLIFEKGNSRYLENPLWKGISDELRDPRDMLHSAASSTAIQNGGPPTDAFQIDDSELILSLRMPPGNLRSLHPQPPHIFLLWQAFLDNVNPLVKLLHAPTVQRQILKATSNLDAVDPETEVLMFAIYTFAVTSLGPEECQTTFGEDKHRMLTRFQHATKLALHRAGFLRSSSLTVLQAYILYLLSMRPYLDIQTLWSLSAIAVRMGQRIGLHRDGSQSGLPLFDIEIRRRVWWQLMPLDIRTSELAGGTAALFSRMWDTETPLNVNDSELNPDMKQLPVEHAGPTEMFFCLLRYTLGKFMRKSTIDTYFDGDLPNINSSEVPLPEKDKAINKLESMLEEKFLKHCDPSIPLHYLTAIVARCALSVMRLLSHHPRQYADKGKTLPLSEKDFLFNISLKIVELDSLAHGDPSLHRFMWHMDAFFQWEAFIYLLSELRTRTSPSEKDIEKAWFQVNKVLEFHPDVLDIMKNPLHHAVANLTAKAWDAYTVEAQRQHRSPPSLQDYRAIEVLISRAREQQTRSPRAHDQLPNSVIAEIREAAAGRTPDGKGTPPANGTSGWNTPQLTAQLDDSPMNWDMWDDMLAEFGLGMEVFGGFSAGGLTSS